MKVLSKRAVSTIVATVIMVNIAVVLGVTAYLYSQNMLGVLIGNYNIYIERNKEMMQERISIANIRYSDDPYSDDFALNITVLNSGARHVYISSIYLNGTDILQNEEVSTVWNGAGETQSPNGDGTYTIIVGNSSTFAFEATGETIQKISYDCVQSIIVVTKDGVKAQEEWLATTGV